MAATSEMEALREENEMLTEENARLKATRAARQFSPISWTANEMRLSIKNRHGGCFLVGRDWVGTKKTA